MTIQSLPSKELLTALMAFITAETRDESQCIVEQHPELLTPAVDSLMQSLVRVQTSEELRRIVETNRGLLARCRTVGVLQAFEELRLHSGSNAEDGSDIESMADLKTVFTEVERLEALWRQDPTAAQRLIERYEWLLERLDAHENSRLRASIQHNLGGVYAGLSSGDHAVNLRRAITCYQEALRYRTPEAAPLDYANTQHNLGRSYYDLPTGDRAANLGQAIACFQEARRFLTPEAAPLNYALLLHNLGSAYAALPTGDRAANLQHAIVCLQETLRFYTPEAAPFDYAKTQNSLGNAYTNLPTGDRTANLHQAIACFQEALRFRTPEASPLACARTQNNLGNAYTALLTGDRSANLHQAIACFQEALRFLTPEASPLAYATTQYNAGNAYASLPTGDHTANLHQAIACFQEALRFHTPEASPLAYAGVQNSLGNAYAALLTEDRASNLRQAIACYQEALRYWTPETAPFDYAMVLNNLGYAYYMLPIGDRSANLHQAIAYFQEAVHVFSPATAPLDYAATQNHLGNAYSALPSGDRSANLRQAITCYQEALRYWTLEAAPNKYAGTQNNLGMAYSKLWSGDHSANVYQAIACFQEALRVWTPEITPFDYAMAQNNLGTAYYSLPSAEPDAKFRQAITCFQEALRVWTPEVAPLNYAMAQNNLGNVYNCLLSGDRNANLYQSITCYEEALRFWTSETSPLNYAAAQNNLGNAYAELTIGDRSANLHQAISCYQEALRVFTPEAAPNDCRRTNHNLANLYFGAGMWPEALAAYRAAIETGEILYQAGLSAASKVSEVVIDSAIYRNAAFAAAQHGDPAEALLILERGKTRLLAEALRLHMPRPEGVPDAAWQAFLEAGLTVRTTQAEKPLLSASAQDPVQDYEALIQQAQAARVALESAVKQVQHYAPGFLQPLTLTTIRTLLPDPQTALITFCLTEQGSLALVLPHGVDTPIQPVELPGVTSQRLNVLLHGSEEPGPEGWVSAYMSRDPARWQATMDRILAIVGAEMLAPILAALPSAITRLILLPSGPLFLLPLHAAPLPGSSGLRLCDCYEISFAPSAEVLVDCRAKAPLRAGATLFAVINPAEDPGLAFTLAEGQAIAQLFANPQIIMGATGREELVRSQIAGHAFVHFSCHGAYDWDNPPQSGLELAEGGRLTLAELQTDAVDLSAARLVTLSACETGISDIFQGSAEEYLGLPAGFLIAGVPCVVSSLWAVPDLSTALLMGRFYELHRHDGLGAAAALRAAQNWVHTLPVGAVASYAEQAYHQAEPAYQSTLLSSWKHYRHLAEQDPALCPFAHPASWAAFTVNGM